LAVEGVVVEDIGFCNPSSEYIFDKLLNGFGVALGVVVLGVVLGVVVSEVVVIVSN